jgi:rieske iron-sulfur protein
MPKERHPNPADRTEAICGQQNPADARPSGVVEPDRRMMLQIAVAAGLAAAVGGPAAAAPAPQEPKNMRPQQGDVFVFAAGDKEGAEIKPEDLKPDERQVLAWPMDPQTKTRRDGSRLNQVLLVRVDPASLDEPTRPHAADGIVAYSATCTHAQCPVAGWNGEKKVFHCDCHQSEFDPRQSGKKVAGPAPRPLPVLPLKITDGVLVAAGTFLGKVGTGSS